MRNFISTLALAGTALACTPSEQSGSVESKHTSQPRVSDVGVQAVGSIEGTPELAVHSEETPMIPEIEGIEDEDPVASLEDPPGTPKVFIEVRPGENLVALSDWARTTPTELARLNGMDVQDTLFAGQKLGLSLEGEEVDAFYEARDRALDARVDRYLDRRGGLYTVESHAIRQGETAWGVGQERGEIPLWVLAAFNQDVELSQLSIGDLLSVPVVEDTIQASAGLDHGPSAEVAIVPESEDEAF
ncbi:MAG: LysM peptidoglycan-binding domain-containing protein [Myxococcota bacterium]|nr:LysM peptidoglycan-binding domain-containing protein [Myxococcota bacterium]